MQHHEHHITQPGTKNEMDHSVHHDHYAMMHEEFRKRFWVTLALTIPVMLLSPMIQHWLHVNWRFAGDNYLLFALSSFVFLYGGWPFLQGLLSELKNRNPGMMTLVAVAITVAYLYSIATVFVLTGMDFFWELASLILIMLLGHWMEMKSVAGASRELELLVKLMPAIAHKIHHEHIQDVRTDSLQQGDLILIKPGENVAADGTIVDGDSYVNESMLTGESVPVRKQKNDKVIAGSLNGNGSLKLTVSHSSAESYLSRVIKLVQDAQKTKSKTQRLADKAARILTIVALVAGGVTFFSWWVLAHQTISFAMERMVTVIVICCPHALGLAVPLVVAISTSLSAKHGLLIRNRAAFENSRKITSILFDKTGTLTEGRFQVVRVQSVDPEFDEARLIRLAASIESQSEHPVATGIVNKAKEMNLVLLQVDGFHALPGEGAEGCLDGKVVKVVSPGYIQAHGLDMPSGISGSANETVIFLLVDEKLGGFIALADKIRNDSFKAIETLHVHGIKSILLTGDNKKVARSVCEALKMDDFIAEVLPHQKQQKVKELQARGEFVAMTGDGVNDAPALAQADVGIAVGSGSDIAAETAGIVLVNSNPLDVTNLILFGKVTYRKMVQNLIYATGYNVVALPLAAGVLYNYGILLSPAAGAVLMSLSTIVVAVNAKMLKVKTN